MKMSNIPKSIARTAGAILSRHLVVNAAGMDGTMLAMKTRYGIRQEQSGNVTIATVKARITGAGIVITI